MSSIGCSTCFEAFTPECEVSTTPCNHLFHTNCITEWIETGRKNCPKCRKPCKINQLRKIFFSTVHDQNKSFKCHVCLVLLENQSALNAHLNSVHEDVLKFQCSICDKFFIGKSGKRHLQVHIQSVHEKKKPFQCSTCNKSFSDKSKLKRHSENVHKVKESFEYAGSHFLSSLPPPP